jgi:hypothetical protein
LRSNIIASGVGDTQELVELGGTNGAIDASGTAEASGLVVLGEGDQGLQIQGGGRSRS